MFRLEFTGKFLFINRSDGPTLPATEQGVTFTSRIFSKSTVLAYTESLKMVSYVGWEFEKEYIRFLSRTYEENLVYFSPINHFVAHSIKNVVIEFTHGNNLCDKTFGMDHDPDIVNSNINLVTMGVICKLHYPFNEYSVRDYILMVEKTLTNLFPEEYDKILTDVLEITKIYELDNLEISRKILSMLPNIANLANTSGDIYKSIRLYTNKLCEEICLNKA